MEPTELPSEEDRKDLRAEGVYPLSPFLIRVGGLCGVCLGIVLVRGEASGLVSLVHGVWEQGVFPLDRLTDPLERTLSLLFRVIGGIVGGGGLGAGGRRIAQRARQVVASDVAHADTGAAHADTGDTGANQLCCICFHFSLLECSLEVGVMRLCQ